MFPLRNYLACCIKSTEPQLGKKMQFFRKQHFVWTFRRGIMGGTQHIIKNILNWIFGYAENMGIIDVWERNNLPMSTNTFVFEKKIFCKQTSGLLRGTTIAIALTMHERPVQKKIQIHANWSTCDTSARLHDPKWVTQWATPEMRELRKSRRW